MLLADTITRSIADQARTIRIPVHMIETINKIVRTQRLILSEFARSDPRRISKETRMPLEKVRKVLKISKEPYLEKPLEMKKIAVWEILLKILKFCST